MTLAEIHSNLLGTPPAMECAETLRPEDSTCSTSGGLKVCSGCRGTIVERYYLLVGDRSWHQQCLKCQVCQRTLSDEITCYDKLGRIYCREDYVKLFGSQKACSKCQGPVSPSELVMKVRTCVYHLACFCCASCERQLCPGEYFGMDGEHVFCRMHYEHMREQWSSAFSAHKSGDLDREDGAPPKNPKGRPRKKKAPKAASEEPLEGHPESPRGAPNDPSCERSSAGTPLPAFDGASEGGLDEGPLEADSPDRPGHLPCASSSSSSASSSHPQRQKRVRTSFKHHQLRTMKSYFAINHNPDAKDLKQLAEKTGLSKRVLQVWFQNARAKFRRSLMKHQGGESCLGPKVLNSPSPHKLCPTDSNGNALALHHPLDHPGAFLRPPGLSEQHSPSQSDQSSNASLPDLSMGMDLSAPQPPQQQHRGTPMGLSLPVY